uniref:RRM domain-containing protein n=1 Tax=Chenopodium quinoa TaxID=63459 RepID=A0A803MNF5_CHEQI
MAERPHVIDMLWPVFLLHPVLLHPRLPGLSFRTTQESLRNAFQKFGQLVEVNLVMDKIANRPRGFAFLRYETEEESMNAIEGMHGKI